MQDITDRKRAEELRNLNQRLTDVIEFLPDATFVIDSDKKIITWNQAIEEMTGFKKEQMLGKGDHAYGQLYGEPGASPLTSCSARMMTTRNRTISFRRRAAPFTWSTMPC